MLVYKRVLTGVTSHVVLMDIKRDQYE